VHLLFFIWHGVFFAIPPLPVLQPHCDKIAITHMFVSATMFFLQSQHISGLQPHCQGCFAITCIFYQVATTSSKDQSSHIKLFTSFLQSHCYKGAITLRQDLQSTTFWFATVFFAIAAHQSLQTHCKGCYNHQYFDQVATHQAKTTLAAILQCRGTGAFF
jgi:hypothetical protein